MHVLYVEDNPHDADLARRELARHAPQIHLEIALSLSAARARLAAGPAPDLVLVDLRLPDGSGLELLAEVRQQGLPLAVVVLTGQGDEETAVAALKAGADDYLTKKEGYLGRLPLALEAALARHRAEASRRAGVLRVLYAEHNAADADLTRRHLERLAPHLRLEVVAHARQVLQRLPADPAGPCPCEVLLLDYRLPGENALELLKVVRDERRLDLPVVLVTGQGDEEVAVQALRLGAADYLVKNPGYLHKLPAVLENAHHRARLAREQAVLGEREGRFRQLTENIQEVFWMTDPAKNQMLYISPAYERIWGRTCTSLYAQPRNWLEAIHPEDRPRVLQASLTRQAEGTYDEEYRIVHADGSLRWIHDRAFPVRNAAGQVYRIVGVAEDITAHKQAEQVRQQAEQRYRQLFEEAPVMYVITRPREGVPVIEDCNQQFLRALGYERQEVTGRPVADFYTPASRTQLLEKGGYQRALAGHFVSEERQLVARDGRVIETILQAMPELDAEGRVAGTRAMFTDVTAQKQAEQERDRLFDYSIDLFCIAGFDGYFKQLNPAWAQTLGWTKDELLAKPYLEFVHPDDRHATIHAAGTLVEGKQVFSFENRYRCRDGAYKCFSWNSYPLADEGLIFAVARDITAQKQEERQRLVLQELRQEVGKMQQASQIDQVLVAARTALARLEVPFQNCSINVIAEGPPLGIHSRVLTPERAWETWTTTGYEDLIQFIVAIRDQGQPAYRRDLDQEDLHGEAAGLAAVYGHPVRSVLDVPFSHGTLAINSPRPDAFSEADIAAVDRVTGVLSEGFRRLEDLKALEIKEQQLRQAQKLEAVGQLAGGVAHDFNNLLTVVSGYSELMLRRLDPNHPHHAHLQEIQAVADRGAGLVRQLLAFSRRQVLQPQVLDLNTLVGNLEKMLRRLIREDIELSFDLAPDLGQVRADPGQVEQVLLNLSVNARDAMPQGGTLLLQTRNEKLDEIYAARHGVVEPGAYVLLAVSDTGIGMDAATQARIFEPFFTTKAPGQGTGLGLATVYGIVKQSEGYIWVYSEPGKGTTFKVYLPRIEAEVAQVAREELPQAEGRGETLLLVEDEKALRDLAVLILRESGYVVLAAGRGDEALELAARHSGPIHLLLTDMVMPGMNGRALADQLRARRPELKVVYMSGYAEKIAEQQEELPAGAAFLQKPFRSSALLLKVRQVLEGSI
jgi:PAS domain S-box-containing protein